MRMYIFHGDAAVADDVVLLFLLCRSACKEDAPGVSDGARAGGGGAAGVQRGGLCAQPRGLQADGPGAG